MSEPAKESKPDQKADEQKKAEEQKMVKLYMDLTGSTEASARNVVMLVDKPKETEPKPDEKKDNP